MTLSPQPSRLPLWVREMVWPCLFWLGALTVVGYQQSPGIEGNYLEFIGVSLCLGTVAGVPVLVFWSLLVRRVFVWMKVESERLRAAISLMPWLSALAVSVMMWLVDPPSPHAYFERTFGFNLAEDACDFRAHGHFLIDSNHADYFFRCSETSAKQVTEALDLEFIEMEGLPFYPAHDFLTGVPDPQEWTGQRQYVKFGGLSGPMYFMVTNSSMTEVFITRTFFPGMEELEEMLSSMPGSEESR